MAKDMKTMAQTQKSNVDEKVGSSEAKWILPLATCIVLLACFYNLILSLINSHIVPLSGSALIVAESLMLLCALPILFKNMTLGFCLLVSLIAFNFFTLFLIRQDFDAKPLRDVLMPIIFLWLGLMVHRRDHADRLLGGIALIVIVVGVVDVLFPDFYADFVDALGFYANRWSTDPYKLLTLQERPAGIGRSLFPFLLGPRRISSVFLDPVAMGNFAVILAAWAFSKEKPEVIRMSFFLICSAVVVVLCDGRFALMLVLIIAACRVSKIDRLYFLPAILPVIGIALVLTVALLFPGQQLGDNFLGRLYSCGQDLLGLDFPSLFGVGSRLVNLDAGYGYVIQKFGVLLCIVLWLAYCFLPAHDAVAQRFRFYLSVYMVLLLSISGSSLFALKTSGILWFLFGALIASAPKIATSINARQPGLSFSLQRFKPLQPTSMSVR